MNAVTAYCFISVLIYSISACRTRRKSTRKSTPSHRHCPARTPTPRRLLYLSSIRTSKALYLSFPNRPSTTQPGPQLGMEAGTGSLKMASTCGDGYARRRARHLMMMMMMMIIICVLRWQGRGPSAAAKGFFLHEGANNIGDARRRNMTSYCWRQGRCCHSLIEDGLRG